MDLRDFDREAYAASVAQRRSAEHLILYCCAFVPASATGTARLLAVGDSAGRIRVYDVKEITQSWLQYHVPAKPRLQFTAHTGSVNCMLLLQAGSRSLLLTGGDDCTLNAWDVSQLAQACESEDGPAVTPSWTFHVPRTTSPLGIVAKDSTATMITADRINSVVYIGAGDGACHAVQVTEAGPQLLNSFTGHVAGVLGVDFCDVTGQLASSSEDSMVRLWDARAGVRSSRVINAWEGADVGDQPAALLKQVDGPPITAVRFDPTGSWLICSCGDLGLSCMSLLAGGLLEQPNTSCTPQFLSIQPGEILSVGTEPHLTHYSFAFRQTHQHALSVPSAFWIDVDPSDGLIAVCGSRGSLDLLTQHGSCVGSLTPAKPSG